jgi:hypothetical protein
MAPKRKTPQNGPVTLQHPIPGINTSHPDGYVRQIVVGGSILDYRLKLYGDVNVNINGNIMRPGFDTWRVQEAYDKMWGLYSDLIKDCEVTPFHAEQLVEYNDLVVCTAPAKRLCFYKGGHEFLSVPIALKFRTSVPNQPDNTVVYSARSEDEWVRSSSIFGVAVTDYKPENCPDPDLIIYKPLGTNCDCHPKMLRVGRYGKWHNLAWIDSAYTETREALLSMANRSSWDAVG